MNGERQTPSHPVPGSVESTATRILLVEDYEPLRTSLSHLLTSEGYKVTEACNGRVAMQRMSEQPADLVITDMIMPEMDGVETIVALKRQFPGVKIISISGGGIGPADYYLRLAGMLGCQKVFAKPLIPSEFLAAIQELTNPAQGR